jgi:NADPH:quinone reductase-like Zn-dependent oxidoreductase
MQHYRLDHFGTLNGLKPGEQPTPQPAAGQVLIRVRARSVNFRDLLILHQRYPFPARPGVIPLSDGAGEIVELGESVSSLAVGDRVAPIYFPRWQSGDLEMPMAAEQFGCSRDGMLAEFVIADAQAVVKLPSHLSFEEACTLPCAAVTAWNAIVGGRRLGPADSVLTIGTGGVALFALQFAKLHGAKVISITSSGSKAEVLRQLGADHVVNRSEHPNWAAQVRHVTSGRGVDQVVETGAIDTLPQSLAACGANAEVALVAALGTGTLDAGALRGLVTLRRVFVGSRSSFEQMNRAIEAHGLRPVVDRVFPFAEATHAYRHFESKRHIGKVIVAEA